MARLLKAADEAWERKDFQEMIDLLERACRLDVANHRTLIRLGYVYGYQYRYEDAERCFEKAVRLAPNKAQSMAEVAHVSSEFGSHQISEKYFLLAQQQTDAPAESFVGLAHLYEHFARLDEAAELVDRALKLDKGCIAALLAQARLNRLAGRTEDAIVSIRAFAPKAAGETQVKAYYELGMALDRQGDYDGAMASFVKAKALLRAQAAPLLAKFHANRSCLIQRRATISSEMLQRWFDSNSELIPCRRLAYLGGHPRSGTTLLEQVLDSHPDAVSAEETPNFLDSAFLPLKPIGRDDLSLVDVLESATLESLRGSRENYFHSMELHLGQAIGGRMLVDKHPALNLFIPAFIRIFPEVKLLIAIRDPRDVCLSCFMQSYVPVRIGSVAYLNLEDLVESYALTMGQWLALSPLLKNSFMEVRYEDTVSDLESTARRVLDFLGLAWHPVVLGFNKHAQERRVRTPSYADVTKPVFKTAVGRWRNYQKYFEPHLAKLEPLVKAFGYG